MDRETVLCCMLCDLFACSWCVVKTCSQAVCGGDSGIYTILEYKGVKIVSSGEKGKNLELGSRQEKAVIKKVHCNDHSNKDILHDCEFEPKPNIFL